jgi:hypothetical protein
MLRLDPYNSAATGSILLITTNWKKLQNVFFFLQESKDLLMWSVEQCCESGSGAFFYLLIRDG